MRRPKRYRPTSWSFFQSPDPAKDGRTITVVETLDRAAERLEADFVDQPERKAQLQKVIGKTYYSLGMGEKAIPLQQQVVDHYRQTRGSVNRETLNEMAALSTFVRWNSAGGALESIPLKEEILAARRESLGSDHTNTLSTMFGLTADYLSTGREVDALELSAELLRPAESTLPLE